MDFSNDYDLVTYIFHDDIIFLGWFVNSGKTRTQTAIDQNIGFIVCL